MSQSFERVKRNLRDFRSLSELARDWAWQLSPSMSGRRSHLADLPGRPSRHLPAVAHDLPMGQGDGLGLESACGIRATAAGPPC